MTSKSNQHKYKPYIEFFGKIPFKEVVGALDGMVINAYTPANKKSLLEEDEARNVSKHHGHLRF